MLCDFITLCFYWPLEDIFGPKQKNGNLIFGQEGS